MTCTKKRKVLSSFHVRLSGKLRVVRNYKSDRVLSPSLSLPAPNPPHPSPLSPVCLRFFTFSSSPNRKSVPGFTNFCERLRSRAPNQVPLARRRDTCQYSDRLSSHWLPAKNGVVFTPWVPCLKLFTYLLHSI